MSHLEIYLEKTSNHYGTSVQKDDKCKEQSTYSQTENGNGTKERNYSLREKAESD